METKYANEHVLHACRLDSADAWWSSVPANVAEDHEASLSSGALLLRELGRTHITAQHSVELASQVEHTTGCGSRIQGFHGNWIACAGPSRRCDIERA